MDLIESVRRKWRRFMGRDPFFDIDAQLEAIKAEVEFAFALRHMQTTRETFDKRATSSAPPAGLTSISGLNAKLELDDQMMKEALNELDSNEDHGAADRGGRTKKSD